MSNPLDGKELEVKAFILAIGKYATAQGEQEKEACAKELLFTQRVLLDLGLTREQLIIIRETTIDGLGEFIANSYIDKFGL